MENKCKNCSLDISSTYKLTCPNCGVSLCENCATKSLRICPNCYHDLELKQ